MLDRNVIVVVIEIGILCECFMLLQRSGLRLLLLLLLFLLLLLQYELLIVLCKLLCFIFLYLLFFFELLFHIFPVFFNPLFDSKLFLCFFTL